MGNWSSLPSKFQSTLPARGSDFHSVLGLGRVVVSIHAPREGERLAAGNDLVIDTGFNPRSPRGGATVGYGQMTVDNVFQSTLPARGSDHGRRRQLERTRRFQSTLPARGSDFWQFRFSARTGVSIHAPREGERPIQFCAHAGIVGFQSTLPARGSDAI